MSWYKVSMTPDEVIAGKALKLQTEFTALFMTTGANTEAAMFCNRGGRENVYYFTPEAYRIAPVLIARYGGTECPTPPGSSLCVLVANGSKWQEFIAPLAFPSAG
jgi:hypothetical protein